MSASENEDLFIGKSASLRTETPTGYRFTPTRADQVLDDAADLYRQRNEIYGNNFDKVAAVLCALFPDGVVLKSEDDFRRWHNFELKVVKLCRFAQSGLTHMDSIRDDCVYSAIVEAVTTKDSQPIGAPK